MPTQYGFIERVTFLGPSAARIAANLNVLTFFPATGITQGSTLFSQRYVQYENVRFLGPSAATKAANLLILQAVTQPDYTLLGFDTYGWPPPPPPFVLPMPGLVNNLISFAPYNPAIDVLRINKTQTYFQPSEVFTYPVTFSTVVRDVPPAPPFRLLLSGSLDIYDFGNGTIQVSWLPLTVPDPDSYNVYVNGVFNQNVPSKIAFVSGLQGASYVNGVLTPAQTYNIRVVAVLQGVEIVPSEDRNVTVMPTSEMLTTPMKRPFPFPNTGSTGA